MRILIVDDEPPARARLRAMLADTGIGEVLGECADGASAMACILQQPVDVVLLDIRMPGMDGLEVARHLCALPTPPAVIFTTAYDSHALAAFETQAVDYLLKPIRQDRLVAALQRARSLTRAQLLGLGESVGDNVVRTHVSASINGNLRLVPIAEVCYLRAEHKYVTARHIHGELVLDESLAVMEREFGDRFLRVHRNALVAPAHVRGLTRDGKGTYSVLFHSIDDTVEVSRRHVRAVRDRLTFAD
ncbi:MAG: response regulator transcription factor [Gammaproteobacteria bacterium]|nr:response regulator transcription factor [Gammaproteobacteria bacterium]